MDLQDSERLAREIVVQLANTVPPIRQATANINFVACVFCTHIWPNEQWDEAQDETQHTEDCVWRLAVEYVANLDNEGYTPNREGITWTLKT